MCPCGMGLSSSFRSDAAEREDRQGAVPAGFSQGSQPLGSTVYSLGRSGVDRAKCDEVGALLTSDPNFSYAVCGNPDQHLCSDLSANNLSR